MKNKPLTIRPLTANEATAVSGGLSLVAPEKLQRRPLLHPIDPNPSKDIAGDSPFYPTIGVPIFEG